ncbi:MAG: DUF1330 domain-containing protein [Rhodospirillaceae bacterium]|jgi:uncharacterized protein (DUF1330 family)|nr:DUF1330 domain-containing protein [Rhodospirillaceae bacterium]
MAESKQPTAGQLRNFRDHPRKGVIQMINLLKFRAQAQYQDGEVGDGDVSGREAYLRYGAAVGEIVASLGGRIVWSGQPEVMVIGDDGDIWDEVVVVEYPSRDAFLQMIAMPEYQAAHFHRDAGLEKQYLVECRPGGDAIS